MTILGVDFTSAPRHRKPITGTAASLNGNRLSFTQSYRWSSFTEWMDVMAQAGPYVAGLDFPFGMPAEFVRGAGWPAQWSDYVAVVGAVGKGGFVDAIRQYARSQQAGHKYHMRTSDRLARACSPMMVDYTPVGRMFAEGAPRLAELNLDIVPCRRLQSDRVAVEAYPGAFARRFTTVGYKSDARADAKSDTRRQARIRLTDAIISGECQAIYGISVDVQTIDVSTMIDDATGDTLDAMICAIQAAWAFRSGFLGRKFDLPDEGCIADPIADSICPWATPLQSETRQIFQSGKIVAPSFS